MRLKLSVFLRRNRASPRAAPAWSGNSVLQLADTTLAADPR